MPYNSLSMAMNNIIWVESEQAARSAPVAFGNSVLFMDKNEDRFYIKSVDQSGVMTGFRRFTRIEEPEPIPEGMVSKEDFDKLQSRMDALLNEMEKLKKSKTEQKNTYNNYQKNGGNRNGQ